MGADVLLTQGARASTIMIFTMLIHVLVLFSNIFLTYIKSVTIENALECVSEDPIVLSHNDYSPRSEHPERRLFAHML